MFVHKKRKETPASSNEGHTDEQERITNVTDVSDFFTLRHDNFHEINRKPNHYLLRMSKPRHESTKSKRG